MTTRRDFLRKTAIGSVAASLATSIPARSRAQVSGANNRVRIALLGCKRRFNAIASRTLAELSNVEVTWVCDVDQRRMEDGAGKIEEVMGYRPKTHEDLRHIIEQPDVDAVFHLTPDHWHTPGALMTVQAGKHAYVEKPCSHNLRESEMLVEAQRVYSPLIQMGTQRRSSAATTQAVRAIHDGLIGEPYEATAFYSNGRARVPDAKQVPVPDYLNWDLFQGPAPRRPYHDIFGDYMWHWFWTWGTAETGNNATHELDVARWALRAEVPEWVQVRSAKRHFKDDPWVMYDSMEATFQFPGGKTIQWDGKSRNPYKTYGFGRGTIVYGTDGSAFINGGTYKIYDRAGEVIQSSEGKDNDSGVALGGGGNMTTAHVRNFIEAIRGNEKLTAPIDIGATSTNLCHYANISSRAGDAKVLVETVSGRLTDAHLAREYFEREYEPGWYPKV